jgi:hypothetical protein
VRITWPGLLPAQTVTNPALGIALPIGAQVEQLPAGIRHYLRDYTSTAAPSALAAPIAPATNPTAGIDLPVGASYSDLPTGVTDYVRSTTVAVHTNPAFGISMPSGVTMADLPAGLTSARSVAYTSYQQCRTRH